MKLPLKSFWYKVGKLAIFLKSHNASLNKVFPYDYYEHFDVVQGKKDKSFVNFISIENFFFFFSGIY